MKNHLVMYSGGAGSWHAGKRVVAKYGSEGVRLIFTDTLMEDTDLYRFLVEGAYNIFGLASPPAIDLPELPSIPEGENDYGVIAESYLEYLSIRKQAILSLRDAVIRDLPGFQWIVEGSDPWRVFFDQGFMGNSRVDVCSRILKREPARDYVEGSFSPDDTIIYLGHGWDEEHRVIKAKGNWAPYQLEAPNTEEPLIDPDDVRLSMEAEGIRQPALYREGFPHNNCSGFCVRAGHAHFQLLYDKRPTLYRYMEALEQTFRHTSGKDVSILKDRRGGSPKPLTLVQLRARIQGHDLTDDEACDWGGCGCFSEEYNLAQ
ncbi:MAG: hypothetical protein LC687_02345 [Actinobacteria bacterium]|nr:hypothetical protein [Actinomycetota bacterium]